jgi:hypothetical protein
MFKTEKSVLIAAAVYLAIMAAVVVMSTSCNSTLIIASSRCDIVQGTNTVDKLSEGGGVDAKGSLY